jgi:hypothetical protein
MAWRTALKKMNINPLGGKDTFWYPRRKKKNVNITRLSVSAHHKKLNGSRPFLTSIFQKACMRADVMTSKSGKISIELIPLVTDPNVSKILQVPVVGTKSLLGQEC